MNRLVFSATTSVRAPIGPLLGGLLCALSLGLPSSALAEEPGALRAAQEALAATGFAPGPADGILGPRTIQALAEYQKAEGLPVTGVLDRATEVRLLAPPPAPAVLPHPDRHRSGFRLAGGADLPERVGPPQLSRHETENLTSITSIQAPQILLAAGPEVALALAGPHLQDAALRTEVVRVPALQITPVRLDTAARPARPKESILAAPRVDSTPHTPPPPAQTVRSGVPGGNFLALVMLSVAALTAAFLGLRQAGRRQVKPAEKRVEPSLATVGPPVSRSAPRVKAAPIVAPPEPASDGSPPPGGSYGEALIDALIQRPAPLAGEPDPSAASQTVSTAPRSAGRSRLAALAPEPQGATPQYS